MHGASSVLIKALSIHSDTFWMLSNELTPALFCGNFHPCEEKTYRKSFNPTLPAYELARDVVQSLL